MKLFSIILDEGNNKTNVYFATGHYLTCDETSFVFHSWSYYKFNGNVDDYPLYSIFFNSHYNYVLQYITDVSYAIDYKEINAAIKN